jgi:hypothetical protein
LSDDNGRINRGIPGKIIRGYRISMAAYRQIFGENACHPERSEGSGSTGGEILRFAQDDSPDPSPVRFREAFSPNISRTGTFLADSGHALQAPNLFHKGKRSDGTPSSSIAGEQNNLDLTPQDAYNHTMSTHQ